MKGIFINYRHNDSPTAAGRLAADLAGVFGRKLVFRDIEGLHPGDPYEEVLEHTLENTAAMLVVVGPRWTSITNHEGRMRLTDPDDWVRREIFGALNRDVPVIPILVDGASDPRPEELPEDLKAFAARQTIELTDKHWVRDRDYLIDRLNQIPPLATARHALRWKRYLRIGGVVLFIATAVVAWFMAGPVSVPSVIGVPENTAIDMLESAGFTVGEVSMLEGTLHPPGVTAKQEPEPGSYAVRGSEIKLFIATTTMFEVDLSKWVRIRDQGMTSAEAGIATAMAIETSLAQQGRPTGLSGLYIYEKSRIVDRWKGQYDGADLGAAMFVADHFGAPPEAAWPLADRERPPEDFNWEELDRKAYRYRADTFRINSVERIKDELAKGRPVVAAVPYFSQGWTGDAVRTGVIEFHENDQMQGVHIIVLVGYTPKERRFRFANTCGVEWGNRGFGTMSRDVADKILMLDHMWSIEIKP